MLVCRELTCVLEDECVFFGKNWRRFLKLRHTGIFLWALARIFSRPGTKRLKRETQILASFSTEDFELHDSDYSVDSKEETLTWSYNKGFRIAKFKTIYEDEKVSCLTYAVMKNGADHGKVICLDIYEAGKAKLWKILRASWINITSPWLLACKERNFFTITYSVKDAIVSLALVCVEIGVIYVVALKNLVGQKAGETWPSIEGSTGGLEGHREGWKRLWLYLLTIQIHNITIWAPSGGSETLPRLGSRIWVSFPAPRHCNITLPCSGLSWWDA